MPSLISLSSLRSFYALSYLVIVAAISAFWPIIQPETGAAQSFAVIAILAYGFAYLAPIALLSTLLTRFLPVSDTTRRWPTRLIQGIAIVGVTVILLLIYADYRLYDLYQFHINDFVINLITTPGGIAALGATSSTEQTIGFQVGLILAGVIGLFLLSQRLKTFTDYLNNKRLIGMTCSLLILLGIAELTFAYSRYVGKEGILAAAEVIPFHMDTGAKSLFKKLGVKRTSLSELRLAGGTPEYPLAPIHSATNAPTPNIIMLVAESFRWDLLDPAITPNLWRFAQKSQYYQQHYSGGNRTRMGLFSLFYGIYAPYWYSFEKERVAPVLMNVLRERNYQMALHTSQSFDYPELRHTTFTGVPESQMQELQKGEPWRRDQQNISDLINKLEQRDPKRPFYGFMFFESTHAPYDFPPEDVVRTDYVAELDYVKLNLKENIEKIHARYINAAHHIDREAARLIAYLEAHHMLDNTIVLFTGDHGEEFMEKGHWGHGHGSTFPDEQIRVPFILSIPGQKPAQIQRPTSHLQFAPTLLKYLGITNPVADYSSVDSLDVTLPYFVLGEYDHMGLMSDNYKISFPFTGSTHFRYTLNDRADKPVSREATKQVLADHDPQLQAMIKESRRFIQATGAQK